MRRKLKKNPILHIINGIKYEIEDKPEFDEERVIRIFSDILNSKFPKIKNKVPVIIIKKGEYLGGYDDDRNLIFLNSEIYATQTSRFPEYTMNKVRTLFHELGHYIFGKFLNKEAINYIEKYVAINRKKINLQKVKTLLDKYGIEDLRINFPIVYAILINFIQVYGYDDKKYTRTEYFNYLLSRGVNEIISFTKPASPYMPYGEEIFCEIFANYMIAHKNLLHNDNYKMLKIILPELL